MKRVMHMAVEGALPLDKWMFSRVTVDRFMCLAVGLLWKFMLIVLTRLMGTCTNKGHLIARMGIICDMQV